MNGLLKSTEQSLLRSLVVGKTKADVHYLKVKWSGVDYTDLDDATQLKQGIELQKKLVRDRNNYLKKQVEKFALHYNVIIKQSYGIDDLRAIQRSMNDIHGKSFYRIHLFESNGNRLWSGSAPAQRNIVIVKVGNHYDVPRNMKKLIEKSFFCYDCLESSNSKHRHRCPNVCRSCGYSTMLCTSKYGYSKQCESCKIFFLSPQCYERHRKKRNKVSSSRCDVIKYCELCQSFYNTRNFAPNQGHVCGESQFCIRCADHVAPVKHHACYTRMPTPQNKKDWKEREKTVKLIAFDFETTQAVQKDDGSFDYLKNHEVVCVVARKACYECFDQRRVDKDANCVKCGIHEKILSYCNSDDVLNDFIDWLFRPEHNGSFVFAHYAGRFDHLLLMHGMLKRKILPQVIMKGRRMITGTVIHNECTLHLRDSHNLIPLPLASFGKAFGLVNEEKGEFPFLLIEKRWYHSTLTGLPDIKYYNIGAKTEEKRREFLKWYEAHDSNYIFNFDEELTRYCRKDVEILLLGLIAYRHTLLQLTGWDPYPAVSTLAAYTSFIIRCDHLLPKTLCNFPDNGFSFNRQQSRAAICWLKWKMKETGEFIQHVENGGEVKICLPSLTTHVDGYSVRADGTKVIYEYMGCYHHGHPKCFLPHVMNTLCQQTFGALYANTMHRLKTLQEVYEVQYVWDCEVKKQLRSSREMRDFFNSCEIQRLVLRIGMQGGRTEAFAKYAKATKKMRLVYYDVNSLYPTVFSTADLPVGPAEYIRSGFPPVPSKSFEWTGLGHIRILPPQGLRYPLLAIKQNNTLMFTLCRTCSSQQSKKKCEHSPEERALTGTWTHFEILKALSLGYEILAYFEVWIFKKFSNSLFTKYIKTFYTVKIASSGWPKWVKTDEDKEKCLANYKSTMGIELTADQIENNPSKRAVSKLMLNTSWGKFAQSPSSKKTVFLDGDQFLEYWDNKRHLISTYYEVNSDLFMVSLSMDAEEIHSSTNANLPIAIYTTSHARLILYSMLEASNGCAKYCDTDSIIALIDREKNPFEHMLGDGLGKLVDETPGKIIKQAVFGGAKAYGLQLIDEKTQEVSYILKLRGFTLDYEARQVINFKTLKTLVLHGGDALTTLRYNLKRTHTGIMTVPEVKKYLPVNNKGFYAQQEVLPFGYLNFDDREESTEIDDESEEE